MLLIAHPSAAHADTLPPPAPFDALPQTDKINKVLPIGGPGQALTALDQANMLFDIVGKEPNFFPVPVALMDGIIGFIDFLARFFPQLKVRGSGWVAQSAWCFGPGCC